MWFLFFFNFWHYFLPFYLGGLKSSFSPFLLEALYLSTFKTYLFFQVWFGKKKKECKVSY